MPTVIAFAVEEPGGKAPLKWRRLTAPPGLVSHGGADFVQEPPGGSAAVNGFTVVGLQVLRPGDLVRVVAGGRETAYVYRGRRPTIEPGRGRACRVTGLPITGQAMICTCGQLIIKEEVARKLARCPVCQAELQPQGDPAEPEGYLL